MPDARLLYSSENGDRWLLVRHPDAGRLVVRHEPNPPSGGRASDIELGEFLIRGGQGPEKLALLRLIGSLVDDHKQDRALAPDEAAMPIGFV